MYSSIVGLNAKLLHTYFYRRHITFYIKYSTGKKVNAKGKLYDKYTNYLKHLRVSGLRQKRKRDSTDSDESGMINV